MNNLLPTDYQNFIALSRYARWKEDEQRRETWSETVERYIDYMSNHLKKKHNHIIPQATKYDLEDAMMGLSVMPSMRALMTAGSALDEKEFRGYCKGNNIKYTFRESDKGKDEDLKKARVYLNYILES